MIKVIGVNLKGNNINNNSIQKSFNVYYNTIQPSFTGNDFFKKANEYDKNKKNNSVDTNPKLTETNMQKQGFKKVDKSSNIVEALQVVGFVGGTFALGLGVAMLLADGGDPNYVFLPDGTAFMNLKEQRLQSSNIIADGDDGIFKMKNTPLKLDARNYDISQPEKGIYKNLDGSVDIDLMHNKYIDKEHGIFVDPEHNISAFINKDGKMQNLVIPDINDKVSFQQLPQESQKWTAGHITYKPQAITRHDFIEQYGITPERYAAEHEGQTGYAEILPDDNRSAFDKLKDFILNNDTDDKIYDIFGREIIKLEDSNGNISHVALDENLQAFVKEHGFNEEDINKISNFVDTLHLKDYLVKYEPNYANFVDTLPEPIDDFGSLNDF